MSASDADKYNLLLDRCNQSILAILRKNKYKGLDLPDRNFSGESISDRLFLRYVNLEKADLEYADLRYADLNGSNLKGADLENAYLTGSSLMMTDLKGADLTNAHLEEVRLRKNDYFRIITLLKDPDVRKYYKKHKIKVAKLINNNLKETDLRYAKLNGADLQGADLQGANLTGADLQDTNLKWADLSGANLKKAENLTKEQLQSAIISPTTKLPEELKDYKNELIKQSIKNLIAKKLHYGY